MDSTIDDRTLHEVSFLFDNPTPQALTDGYSYTSGRLQKPSEQMFRQLCAHTTSSTAIGLVKATRS